MERPKCKLCSKTFSNGKALGGHMKAHFAALPIPNQTHSQLSDRTESAPSSSSDDRMERRRQQQHEHEEEEHSSRVQGYVLRSNPKKSFVLADPSCHRFDAVSSGAESPPSRPTRRRRSSKRKLVSAESTPLSSVTDSFSPEEDVALCLMMLSRDTGGESARRPGQASRAAQFRCGTCSKVFKSHQALGGHVASHKRAAKNKNSSENGVVAARPMLLDLNMPAPADDYDDNDDDNDQLDLSAVSQIQS